MSQNLTHLDESGAAHMVDVGHKVETERVAVAQGEVRMSATTLAAIVAGNAPKGDVLGTARVAGVMAAKRTPDLIPLCHPLLLSQVAVDLQPDQAHHRVVITATVRCKGQTGVEMEALTGATVAALTVYDMCKALSHAIVLGPAKLRGKRGGKRDVGTIAGEGA